jgi:hypothetical protein
MQGGILPVNAVFSLPLKLGAEFELMICSLEYIDGYRGPVKNCCLGGMILKLLLLPSIINI